MKDMFRKYIGCAINSKASTINDKDFIYILIRLPMMSLLNTKERIQDIFSKLFQMINETNGDINQFLCDTILVLYGVPLMDVDVLDSLEKLVYDMTSVTESLKIIIGCDTGLYGPLGYEKRYIVTAIGTKLLNDYKRLDVLPVDLVHIHRDVVQKMKCLQDIPNIVLID